MKKPHQVAYWIIGRDNESQPKAVAMDLHDANGNLVAETKTAELTAPDWRREATEIAHAYAYKTGVGENVFYDPDSTDAMSTS